MTAARETYWRLFSTELNSATYEIKEEGDMKPTYQLSRLGAKINRVLIAGVLTEKENVGTDDEPMWRGRIQDVPGGIVYINVGRFQPEASASMYTLDTPSLVAVVGKVKSYTNEEGKTFVSVRPERIVQVTSDVQKQWLLDAAKTTWARLVAMKKALQQPEPTAEALSAIGMSQTQAENIALAIEQYGQPDSAAYLKAIQAAIRSLLPERNIDLGLQDDIDAPDEIDFDGEFEGSGTAPSTPSAPASVSPSGDDDRENVVLSLLSELDDGKGAPRDLLESRCTEEGISSMDLEEILENLMQKGLAYEPNLKYIKKIDD